jgi:hypothetical protein
MPQKYEIPEGTRPARCKGCNAEIYWLKTPGKKNMPVDPDGTPHWGSCPKRDQFKKGQKGKKREKSTKLRLVSDGTPNGTRLETTDGVKIEGVVKATWMAKGNSMPRLLLEVLMTDMDVTVDFDNVELLVEHLRDKKEKSGGE